MPTKRTTHRSSAGKKLYAVRDSRASKPMLADRHNLHPQVLRARKVER